MTTYCRDCDLVHPATAGDDPWKWRCLAVKIAAGHKFVDPTFSPNPPYEKCERINTVGECQHFKPKPEPNPDFVREVRSLRAPRKGGTYAPKPVSE